MVKMMINTYKTYGEICILKHLSSIKQQLKDRDTIGRREKNKKMLKTHFRNNCQ